MLEWSCTGFIQRGDNMAVSKKKMATNAKYDAENMKAYTVKYNVRIYEQVEKAMSDSGMNRNKWTTEAIIEKLERDGYLNGK